MSEESHTPDPASRLLADVTPLAGATGIGAIRRGDGKRVVLVADREYVDDRTDADRWRHLLGYLDGLAGGVPVLVQVVTEAEFGAAVTR